MNLLSGTSIFTLFMELVIGQDKTDGQADFEEVMISCGYLAQVCVNLFFSVGVMGEQNLFHNIYSVARKFQVGS